MKELGSLEEPLVKDTSLYETLTHGLEKEKVSTTRRLIGKMFDKKR